VHFKTLRAPALKTVRIDAHGKVLQIRVTDHWNLTVSRIAPAGKVQIGIALGGLLTYPEMISLASGASLIPVSSFQRVAVIRKM
jgi:hypothetical protein